MNVKQKIFKNKENDKPKNRYNVPVQNQSSPNIHKSKDNINDKENRFYNINQKGPSQPFYKHNDLQMLKSMELPKRFRTSVNDQDNYFFKKSKKQNEDRAQLYSSQQLFNFKYKNPTERVQGVNFREDLTFGQVNNRRRLITSRQFLQQKKLKTQVIDEIIQNQKRKFCKSLNQFSLHLGNCSNHNNKKAKYRLISQLTEGQKEMFYCSKCAINLLQRGFKIEQIKEQQFDNKNSLMRMKQISKFELRLKSLEERSRTLVLEDVYKDDLVMIEQQIQAVNSKFDDMIYLLQDMRSKHLIGLNEIYAKRQYDRKINIDSLRSVQKQIQSIQREVKDYISTNSLLTIKQNQFNFLISNLTNKIENFQENLASHYLTSKNRHRISFQIISTKQILQNLQKSLRINDDIYAKKTERFKVEQKVQENSMSGQQQIGYDESKEPFRILFPNDQSQHGGECKGFQKRNNMLNSLRQCPTFGSYA